MRRADSQQSLCRLHQLLGAGDTIRRPLRRPAGQTHRCGWRRAGIDRNKETRWLARRWLAALSLQHSAFTKATPHRANAAPQNVATRKQRRPAKARPRRPHRNHTNESVATISRPATLTRLSGLFRSARAPRESNRSRPPVACADFTPDTSTQAAGVADEGHDGAIAREADALARARRAVGG